MYRLKGWAVLGLLSAVTLASCDTGEVAAPSPNPSRAELNLQSEDELSVLHQFAEQIRLAILNGSGPASSSSISGAGRLGTLAEGVRASMNTGDASLFSGYITLCKIGPVGTTATFDISGDPTGVGRYPSGATVTMNAQGLDNLDVFQCRLVWVANSSADGTVNVTITEHAQAGMELYSIVAFRATAEGTTLYASVDNPTSYSFTIPVSGALGATVYFKNRPVEVQPAALGDFVWHDLNANGVQDSGEPGIPGVTVELYGCPAGAVLATTTTDASGLYLFDNLTPGSYSVRFIPPSGYTFSPADQGGNDAADSDANTTTGMTGCYTLAGGETNLTADAGLFQRQGLRVTKTAAGTFDRTITWELTKTVSPTSHSGFAGEIAGSSTWSVTATKTVVEGNNLVTGQITVGNPNGFPVDFTVTDQLNDGTTAVVSCPSTTAPAGGSVTCTYTANPETRAATQNTATVSSSVGSATASAPVSFTPHVTGSESATLADPRFSYSQSISATTPVNFPETFPCPSDPSQYTNGVHTRTETNFATLTFGTTTLRRDAQVTITCRLQFSGETATGFGTVYPNTSNWFMYTAYSTSKVDLVSGRDHKDAGDIFMSRSGSGSSATTTIRIVLHDGWSWDAVDEVLKINPFDRAPTDYLEPGAFLYKFTAPNVAKDPRTTVTFSGNSVTVTMPGHSPRFYGIHADVLRRLP